MTGQISITSATAADEPFLWRLLGEAAEHAGVGPLTPDDAARSPFGLYLQGWGRNGDAAALARPPEGLPCGAAWYRLFPVDAPGYGYLADDIPELTIRVLADWRGQGIGAALLDALCQYAREQGFRALSLSVDRANPARRLYARAGFIAANVSDPADASVTLWRPL